MKLSPVVEEDKARLTTDLKIGDPDEKGLRHATLRITASGSGKNAESRIPAGLLAFLSFEISADASGRVDLRGKPPIVAVAPEMPVYGPTGDIFPLSADRGHRLLFRFHANDLGRARFDGEPLQRSGADLLLQRYDTVFRFVKVRP